MGNTAREIFDSVVRAIGAPKASRWFFSGHDNLEGRSPISALKCGDEHQARGSALRLIKDSGKKLMIVLVCGGRKFADRDLVWKELDKGLAYYGTLTVVQGKCETGADLFAREWARQHPGKVELIDVPADWTDLSHKDAVIRKRSDGTEYDANAGPRRNQLMLDAYQPNALLAFKGGAGTRDMVRRAEKAKKNGMQINIKKVCW